METIEIIEKAFKDNGGWINDNINCYRINEENIISIYVLSYKEDFKYEDALEEIEKNNLMACDYIEMDESVANHLNFKKCYTFHYYI